MCFCLTNASTFEGKITQKSPSMKPCLICLAIKLFVSNAAAAQSGMRLTAFLLPVTSFQNLAKAPAIVRADSVAYQQGASFTIKASNYYTSSLGFFCRKELELEKTLRLPVKFRLGSVAYTDMMEGKGCGRLAVYGKK